MNPKPIASARTRDLALALPALERARKRAEETARVTKTRLVQMVDGKIVFIEPSAPAENDPR